MSTVFGVANSFTAIALDSLVTNNNGAFASIFTLFEPVQFINDLPTS